ncbi:MAG TPA: DinB family protein [Thermoanaerobaculia bacterium]|nr:DinB family protein [Thermoanaerobaculia bacterium]
MTTLSRTTATLATVLFAATVAFAQPAGAPAAKPMTTATPAATASPSPSGFRAELLRQIDENQKKIMDLAAAVPAEKYDWRPAPGVRSVGEVYMHIAGANFLFPSLWGVKPEAGVEPRGFEKQGGDKAKVKETLALSFDHLRRAINGVPEAELGKAIKVFGQEGTVREAMMGASGHLSEHLGQSIAYARMNGVVPPWSAGSGGGGQ